MPATRGLDLDVGAAASDLQATYRSPWAIIIGIDRYHDEHWPALRFAAHDATELRDMLRDEFGFEIERTRLLLNDAATEPAISEALTAWLPKNVQPGDDVLFYFAGHGLRSGELAETEGYLVPSDAQGLPPGKNFVPVRALIERLQKLNCRHTAVILDSCYSGSLFSKVRPTVVSMPGQPQRNGLDYYFSQPAFLGLTAAHDTPVADGSPAIGHSPFTMALLDVLHDRADLPQEPNEANQPSASGWPRATFGFTSLASRVVERVQQAAQQTARWGALAGSAGDGDFLFCPTLARLPPSEKDEHRHYAATIREVLQRIETDVDDADNRLASTPTTFRDWEWRWLMQRCRAGELGRRVFPQPVSGLAASSDGRTVAMACRNGQIELQDPDGNRRAGPNTGAWRVFGMALDGAGKRLAVASDDSVLVVDLATGAKRILCDDLGPDDSTLLVISDRGNVLALANRQRPLRAWNLDAGQAIATPIDVANVAALALSPDGKLLAVAAANRVILHDFDGQRQQTLAAEGAGSVVALAFGATGEQLIAVDQQAAVFTWRMPHAAPEPVRRHEKVQLPVMLAALSRDLARLALLDSNRRLTVREVDDLRAEHPVAYLAGHGAPITRLMFTPDSRTLMTGDNRGLVKVWSTLPGAGDLRYDQHSAPIEAVAVSGHECIASGDAGGDIHLWRPERAGAPLRAERVLHAGGDVSTLAFDPSGKLLASGGRDGVVRLWDAESGEQRTTFTLDGAKEIIAPAMSALAFDPAGRRIAAAYADKNVRIWRVTEELLPKPTRPEFVFGDGGTTARFHQHGLRGVAFFAEGTAVFSAAERLDLRTRRPSSAEWIGWQAGDGEVRFRFDTEHDTARYGVVCQRMHAYAGKVAASCDGRWLAGAGPDQCYSVWDARTGRLVMQAEPEDAAPRHHATDVAFSPSSQRLAVVSTDGMLRLWDVAGEVLLLETDAGAGPLTGIAFSSDGAMLAVAGTKAVRVFLAPEHR